MAIYLYKPNLKAIFDKVANSSEFVQPHSFIKPHSYKLCILQGGKFIGMGVGGGFPKTAFIRPKICYSKSSNTVKCFYYLK